jgi:2-beta-glucuronyltransferase
MIKRAVIFSYHYFNSKNKAGFHYITESLKKLGYEVHFVTTPVSLLSFLKGDIRVKNNRFVSNLFKTQYIDGVFSYINFNLFHPINRNNIFLEKIFLKFYKLNSHLKNAIKNASIIIFESSTALFWIDTIKNINKSAKFVYRMSDDVEYLNLPETLKIKHINIMKKFDLISVPSEFMYKKYTNLVPQVNIKLHFHGIDKKAFDTCNDSCPYDSSYKNAVFVGMSYLDYDFLSIAAKIFKNVKFHIVGNFKDTLNMKNVKFYGVVPFKQSIKYIKYADIGLAIWKADERLIKTLGSSLKILQYTYCKLPIIIPSLVEEQKQNFFKYTYNNEHSIIKAVKDALKFEKDAFEPTNILTWEELTKRLIND